MHIGKGLVVALIAEAVAIAALAVVALDIVAHRRVERLGGVNVWGYRGPVMRQLQANEIRVALAGGDLAFGWGVAASETMAYGVRQLVALRIDQPGRPLQPVTAVNIGAAGLPISDYARWIDRFAYLRPRIICLVVDPIGRRNTARWQLPDRRSLVFAAFGYSPILPLVLEEKGAIANGRLIASAGRLAAALDHAAQPAAATNGGGSADELTAAVRAARAAASGVVVVTPPLTGPNAAADIALHTAVEARFAGDPRVQFVALGDDPSMYDVDTTLDGFHFGAGGHAAAAALVAPAVLSLLGS